MKKIKKALAVLLALAMVMAMSLTAFANNVTSTVQASILGVENEEGVAVKAYQIIKYNEAGYYEEVLPGTITKVDGVLTPNATDVQALAVRTNELGTPVEFTKNGDAYVNSELAVGTWLVVVTGSENFLYNPAIISVQQGADGKIYGTLNLDTDSWTDTLYVKKSEPEIKKVAEKANASDTEVNGVQYGDVIKFTITADVPSYTTNKVDIVYEISDTLTGLALVAGEGYVPVATVGGQNNDELTAAVNAAIVNGATSFKVDSLSDEFIIAHGTEEIVITYYAKVTSAAKLTVDELNNTATLTYSTNDKTQTKADETFHYTFGIDTNITGGSVSQDKTGEFFKVNEDGDIAYNEETGEYEVVDGLPLEGAQFQLHIGSADGALFKDAAGADTFTTDATGRLEINGLDSDVTYYLVETKAPTGYTINTTPVPVKIDATYDADGKLVEYTVKVDNNIVAGYTYSEGKAVIKPGVANPYEFKNTVLSALPSTGGMGTTLFTIGGCIIMILAAAMFFFNRRRSAE